MKRWLMSIVRSVFGGYRFTVGKREPVTVGKLQEFLALLPDKPQGKIKSVEHDHNLIEFVVKIPRARLNKNEKRKAKRRRTWAGGRLPQGKRKLKVVDSSGSSSVNEQESSTQIARN